MIDRIEEAFVKIGFNKLEEGVYEYTQYKQIIVNNQPVNALANKLQLEYIGEGEMVGEYPLYGYHLWRITRENKELLIDVWLKDENDVQTLIIH